MLDGTPSERLAAATALVPLGEHDDRTLPILKQFVHDSPASVQTISRILPWLKWETRQEWFNLLTSSDAGHDDLRQIVTQMVVWPDARAASLLWKQLASYNGAPEAAANGPSQTRRQRSVSDTQIDAVYDALRTLYSRGTQFGGNPPSAAAVKEQQANLKRRAEHGQSFAERVVALAILCELNSPETAEIATAVAADPKATPELRQIAWKTLLLAEPRDDEARNDATSAAVKALGSPEEPLRRLSLLYLAIGPGALSDFGYGITIYRSNLMSFRSSEDGVAPQAPKNLKADMVRPFLKDADPDIAASAGYLLALLGEADGLDALVAPLAFEQRR